MTANLRALRVNGVFRDADNRQSLIVAFNRRPTDDELRSFHDDISAALKAVKDQSDATPAKPDANIGRSVNGDAGRATERTEPHMVSGSASGPNAPSPALRCPVDADGHCYNEKVCTAINACALHTSMKPAPQQRESGPSVVEEIGNLLAIAIGDMTEGAWSVLAVGVLQRARDEILRLQGKL